MEMSDKDKTLNQPVPTN